MLNCKQLFINQTLKLTNIWHKAAAAAATRVRKKLVHYKCSAVPPRRVLTRVFIGNWENTGCKYQLQQQQW